MNNGSFGPHLLRQFLVIQTAHECCQFFRLQHSTLEQLINTPEYQLFTIDKKKGGKRVIEAPSASLKKVQRQINSCLQAYFHLYRLVGVHGFIAQFNAPRQRCPIALNAQHHVGKKVVFNLDLKDFFASISAQRIQAIFRSEPFAFPEEIAIALTLLCTYNGHLPTGAPSSPVLSNFVCLQLDRALLAYAAEHQLSYSRYADDLTFSANTYFTQGMQEDIKQLIVQHGFACNDKKLRIRTAQRKQTVTGLVVNERVNIDRRYIKKARAMLHDLSKNGLESAALKHFGRQTTNPALNTLFLNRLRASIAFIGQVRGAQDATYLKMKQAFQKASTGA